MGIIRYVFKTWGHNLRRAAIIIFGIAISLSLIIGTSLALSRVGTQMYYDKIEDVKVDFTATFYSSSSFNGNFTQLKQQFSSIQTKFPEISAIFAIFDGFLESSKLNPNNQPFNWTDYFNRPYSQNNYSSLRFFGIDQNIIRDYKNIAEIFSFQHENSSWGFDINASNNEVYIDAISAQSFNISIGQKVNLGHLYSEYINETTTLNYTKEFGNVTIKGVFSIIDDTGLRNIFDYYSSSNQIILLSTPDVSYKIYTQLLTNKEIQGSSGGGGYSYYYQSAFYKVGFILDHSKLNVNNPDELKELITKIEREINYISVDESFYVHNNVLYAILSIDSTISIYRMISLAVALPLIILGWFLVKTNYYIIIANRRREIGLLITRLATRKQINTMFITESIIFGVLGGILGLIISVFSSNQVIGIFSKVMDIQQSSVMDIIRSINPSLLINSIILGVILSMISIFAPFKNFKKMEIKEILEKYNKKTEMAKGIKKGDWAILILSIMALVVSIFLNGDRLYQLSDTMPPFVLYFLGIIYSVSSTIMPIMPFMLVYGIVKFVTEYSISFFSKLVARLSRLFDKRTYFFVSKSVIRDRARSGRIIFIISVTLSFIVISDILYTSQNSFARNMIFINRGNDQIFYGDIQYTSYSNGSKELIQNLLNKTTYLEKTPSLNISKATLISRFKTKYSDYIRFGGMSSVKWYSVIPDDYFNALNNLTGLFGDNKSLDVLNALKTMENVTIINKKLSDEQHFCIGDTIKVDYYNQSGDEKSISLKIIAITDALPGIYSNVYFGDNYFVITSLNDTLKLSSIDFPKISSFEIIIDYKNIDFQGAAASGDFRGNSFSYELKVLNNNLLNWWNIKDSESYLSVRNSYMEDFLGIFAVLTNFSNIEKYYLVILVALGIGLIIYESINEKMTDIGILRAKGVERKLIFNMQIAEGAVYVILGGVISLSGIIAAYGLINSMMSLMVMGSGNTFPFIVPIVQIILEIIGISLILAAVILVTTYFQIRATKANEISSLFRFA
ncbi:MAG: ABC transporter permease [Promethearchaeota archaeon]